MGNLLKRLVGDASDVEKADLQVDREPAMSREELSTLFARDLSKQRQRAQPQG